MNESMVESLRSLSDDELLAVVGRGVLSTGLNALPLDAEKAKAEARRWFDHRVVQIKSSLCENSAVRGAGDAETMELITAVAVVIEGFTTGTTVSALAILLVRKGVRRLCKGEWDKL